MDKSLPPNCGVLYGWLATKNIVMSVLSQDKHNKMVEFLMIKIHGNIVRKIEIALH